MVDGKDGSLLVKHKLGDVRLMFVNDSTTIQFRKFSSAPVMQEKHHIEHSVEW